MTAGRRHDDELRRDVRLVPVIIHPREAALPCFVERKKRAAARETCLERLRLALANRLVFERTASWEER